MTMDEYEWKVLEDSGNWPPELLEIAKEASNIDDVDLTFLACAKKALAEEGCSALDFLAANPSIPKVELAKRLNRGTNALGLVMAIYEEAVERQVVRETAKDLLLRQICSEFPDGWCSQGEISPLVHMGSWDSDIGNYTQDSQLSGYAKHIMRDLTIDHPPPDGWKPQAVNDPLIDDLFDRYWPADTKACPSADSVERSVCNNAEQTDGLASSWFDRKCAFMESVLGKEHDVVMHALLPYSLGGTLDLYYYPNGIDGTAIATKELSTSPEHGSSNDSYGVYELVTFTRQRLDLDAVGDELTPFGRMHASINAALNGVAAYSADAKLNPHQTCEFPSDMDFGGGRCFVFDAYTGGVQTGQSEFGLLLVIEVFRSEMEYAQKDGGANLIERLKNAGHYPYSDLDRSPVV